MIALPAVFAPPPDQICSPQSWRNSAKHETATDVPSPLSLTSNPLLSGRIFSMAEDRTRPDQPLLWIASFGDGLIGYDPRPAKPSSSATTRSIPIPSAIISSSACSSIIAALSGLAPTAADSTASTHPPLPLPATAKPTAASLPLSIMASSKMMTATSG